MIGRSPSVAAPTPRPEKAASLKVPVLDEAGFEVLLDQGPEAARPLAVSDDA